MEKKIFRRIPTNAELREYDKISAHFVTRARCIVDNLRGISSNIADCEVDLSQCNFDCVVHLCVAASRP
jgi:hypothetical protein